MQAVQTFTFRRSWAGMMLALGCAAFATCLMSAPQATDAFYPTNRPPLQPAKFAALPVGAIRPEGWLLRQLTLQAQGLTGHLDEFWPSLRDSAWKGGTGDAWERGPYYLDGLVPLAWQLDDPKLKAIAQKYLDFILASSQPNGWFGPEKNKDRWPLAVAAKVLMQYHEATGDPRALQVLQNYLRYLRDNPPDWPDREWRGVRAMEHAVLALWYYNRTGDADALRVLESIHRNSFDWIGYFIEFPFREPRHRPPHPLRHDTHVVNLAMAIKYPGLWLQYSGDARAHHALYAAMGNLDQYHGQVGGRFGGDEHLAGRHPSQGTELCAIVEYMYSLEKLVEYLGDPALADRLEMLAYNCKPGTCTPDYWAHQYDQQANQVLVSRAKRRWTTNGDDSNLYGLEPNFGCCTANMHQGWPKLVAHLWMATPDQGLAAIAYGPCRVQARVADGAPATLRVETDYPFDETILVKVALDRPAAFPLYLRIPAWATNATLKVGARTLKATPGSFVHVQRNWKDGDTVQLRLPMPLRVERRYNNSAAILRGPLYFSLRIGEEFKELQRHHPTLPVVDWEVHPTTAWNYALLLDEKNPGKSFKVRRQPVGAMPFDNATAPVVLTGRGRRVPEWTLEQNSAAAPPASPVVAVGPLETLELVPYGCTRLRITEFPVLAK
ncbi:MAG: glycoside hydrolase family 127 protein [Verrucomicrobiae bacterium]|nr:glycoside hydrolase family 127 protein [Verrucomicrobiae bacterium]